jgi:uncharacterized membrane protein (DUF4010 family)
MEGVDDLELAFRFAVALGLGVLVGLERERSKPATGGFAGVRTIALISLAGGLSSYFELALGQPWLGLGVFAAIAALAVVSYAVTAWRGDLGTTTEISAVIAFLLGALCVRGDLELAAGLTVASAGVLALKDWLHRLAQRIETADVEATLKFAIVTLIVLPIVPNQNFGPPPLAVINPHEIWLMVVLISGLNFASYLLVKVVGAEHGIGLTGLLGGLVSSTAVTLGFSQRSRQHPAQAPALALGILVAWTVMFFRVPLLVALVSPGLARSLLPGMAVLGVPSLALCAFLWRRQRSSRSRETASVSAGQNPFELGQAIRFGALFGVVTFVAKAAEEYLGSSGLYFTGALAGLTDVDAVSLSMAKLASGDAAHLSVAARTIVIAVVSNTLVKGAMAAGFGAPELRRAILPALGAILVAGIAGALLL